MGGGLLQYYRAGGGYYNITEPLGEGGEENQANFIWHNQNHPIPPFLGNKERTPY